ncbi:ankyrin-2-like [Gastrophryne carolinensis]
MSVRELMKAFQSGNDPSKERSGLFEYKTGKSAVQKQSSLESKSTDITGYTGNQDQIQSDYAENESLIHIGMQVSSQLDSEKLRSVSEHIKMYQQSKVYLPMVAVEGEIQKHTVEDSSAPPVNNETLEESGLGMNITDQDTNLYDSPERLLFTDVSDGIKKELNLIHDEIEDTFKPESVQMKSVTESIKLYQQNTVHIPIVAAEEELQKHTVDDSASPSVSNEALKGKPRTALEMNINDQDTDLPISPDRKISTDYTVIKEELEDKDFESEKESQPEEVQLTSVSENIHFYQENKVHLPIVAAEEELQKHTVKDSAGPLVSNEALKEKTSIVLGMNISDQDTDLPISQDRKISADYKVIKEELEDKDFESEKESQPEAVQLMSVSENIHFYQENKVHLPIVAAEEELQKHTVDDSAGPPVCNEALKEKPSIVLGMNISDQDTDLPISPDRKISTDYKVIKEELEDKDFESEKESQPEEVQSMSVSENIHFYHENKVHLPIVAAEEELQKHTVDDSAGPLVCNEALKQKPSIVLGMNISDQDLPISPDRKISTDYKVIKEELEDKDFESGKESQPETVQLKSVSENIYIYQQSKVYVPIVATEEELQKHRMEDSACPQVTNKALYEKPSIAVGIDISDQYTDLHISPDRNISTDMSDIVKEEFEEKDNNREKETQPETVQVKSVSENIQIYQQSQIYVPIVAAEAELQKHIIEESANPQVVIKEELEHKDYEREKESQPESVQLKSVSEHIHIYQQSKMYVPTVATEEELQKHRMEPFVGPPVSNEALKDKPSIALGINISDQDTDLHINSHRKISTEFSEVLKEELQDRDYEKEIESQPELVQIKSVSENIHMYQQSKVYLPIVAAEEELQKHATEDLVGPLVSNEAFREKSSIRLRVSSSEQDIDLQISPDRKASTDFSDVIKQELEDNDRYLQFKHLPETEGAQLNLEQVLISPFNVSFPSEYESDEFIPALHLQSGTYDDSSDSLKHEGAADSPSGSLLEGTPQISSEDSFKHEGLAETPGTSPESLSFSPKQSDHQADDNIKASETIPHMPTADTDIQSPKKLVSEVTETLLETKQNISSVKFIETKCSTTERPHSPTKEAIHGTVKSPQGLELNLSSQILQDEDVCSPTADESVAVSHKDSLEASPVIEDNSSHKTPDSLEPSPSKESPCRDSLENSPVEQKIKSSIFIGSALHSNLKADLATELVHRSRLLRDPDGSNEDDSLDQTSLMESSGKSPLSPDTPSSEEISYEVTPKTQDLQALAGIQRADMIPEEQENDSEMEPKKRFTPEEEMFKMVTKIKMFDELEQEAKQKREYKKEIRQEECAVISTHEDGTEEHGIKIVQGEDVQIVVMSVESRKSSSSSESEPELTQLKKEADSGLLMDPVIRVHPPSPLPPSLDSSSSPEETAFQPITHAQDTFIVGQKPIFEEDTHKGDFREVDSIQFESKDLIDQTSLGDTQVNEPISPNGLEDQSHIHSCDLTEHVEKQTDHRTETDAEREARSIDTFNSLPSEELCHTTQCLEQINDDGAKHAKQSDPSLVLPVNLDSSENTIFNPTNVSSQDDLYASHLSTFSQKDLPEPEDIGAMPVITSPYENVPVEYFFTSHDIIPGMANTQDMVTPISHDAELSVQIESSLKQETKTPSCSASSDDSFRDAVLKDPSESQSEKSIISKPDAESDSWSSIREDDAAFEARVKEEEQKIFGLMVDKQSQGTTPDSTPIRTPTEDGTPTSEQNPFMFQEGKLFEMTRSGAIDMTKRNYAEESFHFFQIDQQCAEGLPEEIKEESAEEESPAPESLSDPFSAVDTDVPSEFLDSADSPFETIADSDFDTVDDDLGSEMTKSDQKSRIPIKMGISAASKSSKPPKKYSDSSPDASPFSDQLVVDMQIDFSTVPKPEASEHGESPDSSPEEQKSVIEIATTAKESSLTHVSKTKIPIRSTSSVSEEQSPTNVQIDKKSSTDVTAVEDQKPKSKIPIKSTMAKTEPCFTFTDVKPSESSKLPVKQDGRSKSESDASVTDSKFKATKTRSCTDSHCEFPENVGEAAEGECIEATKPKSYASRLPVKTKSVSSCPTVTTEQESFFEMYKNSIDFFEEISEEASKLVDRLTQSEREQETVSDDESSAFEISVIENAPVIESYPPAPEDIFDSRPIWDESIETQIERIPDDHSHYSVQGICHKKLDSI